MCDSSEENVTLVAISATITETCGFGLETPHDTGETVPYVIVGDNAFPLQENIRKPYAEKQLNDECREFNY